MIAAYEYGSGEKEVSLNFLYVTWRHIAAHCNDHRPSSEVVTSLSLMVIRVLVRGGELLAAMTDRTFLDYHSLACSFILFYVTFDWSVFLYWELGGGDSLLRSSDCRPANSSRVPGILYQSIELNRSIVCTNQMITSSFFICFGSLDINIPFFSHVGQYHRHHHPRLTRIFSLYR